MTYLAMEPGRLHASNEVSQETQVASPTASKLLKLLSRAELVESERGSKGGYRLARRAKDISIAQVVDALEGPVALTECISDSGNCLQESSCSIRASFQRINGAIRQALEGISLEEMVRPTSPPEVDVSALELST